jgi:hypothetical protein
MAAATAPTRDAFQVAPSAAGEGNTAPPLVDECRVSPTTESGTWRREDEMMAAWSAFCATALHVAFVPHAPPPTARFDVDAYTMP